MADQRGPGGASSHLPGIFQSLIAAGVGSAIAPAVSAYWGWIFHKASPEWAKGVFSSLAGAVLCLGLLFGSKWVHWWATRARRSTPAPKGDRLSIYIALLGDDEESLAARESVILSIRKELGLACLEVIKAGKQFKPTDGVSEEESILNPTRAARDLLRKVGGDLLIWGRLHKINGRVQIELHFVSSNEGHVGGERGIFSVGERLLLDKNFGPEMGVALAAVISSQAAPVFSSSGSYIVEVLQPMANRLQAFVRNLPPSMRTAERTDILNAYGHIQLTIGSQSGTTPHLFQARDSFRALTQLHQGALNRARAQINLGNALASLGEQESGNDHLVQAAAAYREALKEITRERAPVEWALIQNNIGNVLRILGVRWSDTKLLREAVDACYEALTVQTREHLPFEWAMTQNNLGAALNKLGERERGTGEMLQAVSAYRAALEVRTRECCPLDWAMTQSNLGGALTDLGTTKADLLAVEGAVEACREALKEYTRVRVPLAWAQTQNNLGNALTFLGRFRSGNPDLIEAAIVAFEEALKVYTRERTAYSWATTQNNLGLALTTLGTQQRQAAMLLRAIEAHGEALKEFTRERVPLEWARTRDSIGTARLILADVTNESGGLFEAVHSFRDSLMECTRELSPSDWAQTQLRLGIALQALGERMVGIGELTEAATAYENALLEFTDEMFPHLRMEAQDRLQTVEDLIPKRSSSRKDSGWVAENQ